MRTGLAASVLIAFVACKPAPPAEAPLQRPVAFRSVIVPFDVARRSATAAGPADLQAPPPRKLRLGPLYPDCVRGTGCGCTRTTFDARPMDTTRSAAWANVAKDIYSIPEGKLFGCYSLAPAGGGPPETHCRYLRKIAVDSPSVADDGFWDGWLSVAARVQVKDAHPRQLVVECDLSLDESGVPLDAPFRLCRPVMLEGKRGNLAFVDREAPHDTAMCAMGLEPLGEWRAFDLRGCAEPGQCLASAVAELVTELTRGMTTTPISAKVSGPTKRGRMRFVTDRKPSNVITNRPRHEIATYTASLSVEADSDAMKQLPQEFQQGRPSRDGNLAVYIDLERYLLLSVNYGGPYTTPSDADAAEYGAALQAAYGLAVRRACTKISGTMEGETCRRSSVK